MSGSIASKLAVAYKRSNKTVEILTAEHISQLKSREKLIKQVNKFIAGINSSLEVLPRALKFNDKDIAFELRKVRASAQSVVNAVEDKVCKPKVGRRMLKPITANFKDTVELLRGNLEKYVILSAARQGKQVANITQEVDAVTAAATTPKKIILHSLSDLGAEYDRWQQMVENEINKIKLEEEEKNKDYTNEPPPLLIDPKKADAYVDNYTKTPLNFQYNENKYDQRVNENAMQTQQALTNAYRTLPSSIKIGPAGYNLLKLPIIAVTQFYIPDSIINKSGIKYIRIASTFSEGFSPGAKKLKGGNDVSYIVILDQLLLAFPIAITKENNGFLTMYRNAITALSTRLGKLYSMPFGDTGNSIDDDKFVANKRYYFGNPAYPGIGFVWLLPAPIFNVLHKAKYLQINIANTNDMKKQLIQQNIPRNPHENPLIQQKAEREAQTDERLKIAREARAQRELITGPLEVQKAEIDKQKKLIRQEIQVRTSELKDLQDKITAQEQQLRAAQPGGPTYKSLVASLNVLKVAFALKETELKNLSVDRIKDLNLRMGVLNQAIKDAVQKLVTLRREQKSA